MSTPIDITLTTITKEAASLHIAFKASFFASFSSTGVSGLLNLFKSISVNLNIAIPKTKSVTPSATLIQLKSLKYSEYFAG